MAHPTKHRTVHLDNVSEFLSNTAERGFFGTCGLESHPRSKLSQGNKSVRPCRQLFVIRSFVLF